MDKRPVIVFDLEWNKDERRYDKHERCNGWFHAWGLSYEEFESGAGNYSTAIIELDNGEVLNHPAELIKFADK